MSCAQPPRGRLARLFEAADRRHVPLPTILVTAGVVVATYLAGKLMYLLRAAQRQQRMISKYGSIRQRRAGAGLPTAG